MAKIIYTHRNRGMGLIFQELFLQSGSLLRMASEIVSRRVERLNRGSQYVVRSFFNILSSSRSAPSICDDFRDPLATLLTKEGLTFNLLAILAYTPAKADMIFPGVRPPGPG
jgi:hypothetical protein